MSGLKMQDGSVLYSEAENNKMLATIAALREDVERLTKKLERSHLYRNSYYWQEKAMAVLRGEFTQCCSYCGWEAPPPNGWEELQKHIEECPEHPLPKLRARLEAAEQREKRLLAIIDEYSRKLIRVEGGDSVAKEVSHFEEAITVLQGSLKEAVAIINQRDREAIGNRKELAAAENELDQLRKVVWHLERDSQRGAWVLEYYKCQKDLYGLDIAKMQKEMGK